jgi:manganese efflux pump family protein
MSILTSLFLAFGLAMDAFAVAAASGSAAGKFRWKEALRIAALFGFFQALMPAIGWLAGMKFKYLIQSFDHWLAFALLGVIGVVMICDDLKTGAENESDDIEKTGTFFSLLALGVATSIDAMAVGLSLTFLDSILAPAVTIGLVTFALSLAGVCLGHRYRRFGRGKAKLVGGLILIGIGTKILIEHLSE